MSGRSRRVVQNKAAATVAAALEKLNAAKSGAKRVETFELKEEEAVYDVVDDESYAQLQNKRRIEAGGVSCGVSCLMFCSTCLRADQCFNRYKCVRAKSTNQQVE
jgi:hypothetical protein